MGWWNYLTEVVEGLLRQAQDEGWGVQSFDRLRMRGKRLRMRGRGAVLRQAQDEGQGVASFDRLRMRGKRLRMRGSGCRMRGSGCSPSTGSG